MKLIIVYPIVTLHIVVLVCTNAFELRDIRYQSIILALLVWTQSTVEIVIQRLKLTLVWQLHVARVSGSRNETHCLTTCVKKIPNPGTKAIPPIVPSSAWRPPFCLSPHPQFRPLHVTQCHACSQVPSLPCALEERTTGHSRQTYQS